MSPIIVTSILTGRKRCSLTNNESCLVTLESDIPSATGIRACTRVIRRRCFLHTLVAVSRRVVRGTSNNRTGTGALLSSTRRGVCSVERNESMGKPGGVSSIVMGSICSHLRGLANRSGRRFGTVPSNFNVLSGCVAKLGGSSFVLVNTHPTVNGASFTLGLTAGVAVLTGGGYVFFDLRVAGRRLTRELLSTETNVPDRGLHANRLASSR